MELMKLEIVTPLGVIFNDEIKQVTIPGSEGEFGVLAGHATLVSLLDAGVMVIETKESKEISVAINGGYVKVDEEKTICVVEGAVALDAEDSELSASIEEAKALLKKAGGASMALASAMSKVDSIK